MPQLHTRALIRLVTVLLLLLPATAFAQQRPLVTEDPETVGAGNILVEGGIDYSWDVEYPASGLQGNRLRLPLLGVSVGLSSIAEIQLDGGLHNRLAIKERDPAAPLANLVTETGDSTSDVEDIVIGTKVKFLPEGMRRPALGFRFATRLPNANNESGLGLDTTDFYATFVAGKTVQSVRAVGNIGLGILGDPVDGNRQNDVLLYGVSFARALTNQAEVVGEINGQINTRNGDPPAGTDSRGIVRLGARYTISGWRADAAILFGVTPNDPSFGFAAGATYVFNAFRIP
jgi:hypothetical protein